MRKSSRTKVTKTIVSKQKQRSKKRPGSVKTQPQPQPPQPESRHQRFFNLLTETMKNNGTEKEIKIVLKIADEVLSRFWRDMLEEDEENEKVLHYIIDDYYTVNELLGVYDLMCEKEDPLTNFLIAGIEDITKEHRKKYKMAVKIMMATIKNLLSKQINDEKKFSTYRQDIRDEKKLIELIKLIDMEKNYDSKNDANENFWVNRLVIYRNIKTRKDFEIIRKYKNLTELSWFVDVGDNIPHYNLFRLPHLEKINFRSELGEDYYIRNFQVLEDFHRNGGQITVGHVNIDNFYTFYNHEFFFDLYDVEENEYEYLINGEKEDTDSDSYSGGEEEE
jgi:hypothetical protein